MNGASDVYLRISKPRNEGISSKSSQEIVCTIDKKILNVSSINGSTSVLFSDIFTDRNEQLLDLIVKQMAEDCIKGYNCGIICTGHSRTGKTATCDSIVNKVAQELLEMNSKNFNSPLTQLHDTRTSHNYSFELNLQVIEIYGEMIRDLLEPYTISDPLKLVN